MKCHSEVSEIVMPKKTLNLNRFSTRRNCLVISRVELIRKDKEKFRSARKIPPSGKPALKTTNKNMLKVTYKENKF
jgi:hypothetical protein